MKWSLIPKFHKRKTGTSYELLEAVIKAINDEPRRIYMAGWVRDLDVMPDHYLSKPSSDMQPACGTQGCIAGWMKLLTAPTESIAQHWSVYRLALGLLPVEIQDDASRLFGGMRGYAFPKEAKGSMVDQRRYAREVIKNIRKFMKKHQRVLKAHQLNLAQVYGQ